MQTKTLKSNTLKSNARKAKDGQHAKKPNHLYRLGYRIGRLIKRFIDWKHPKLLKLLYLFPVLAIGLYSIFALLWILALSAIGTAAFYELYKNPTAYGDLKDDDNPSYYAYIDEDHDIYVGIGWTKVQ